MQASQRQRYVQTPDGRYIPTGSIYARSAVVGLERGGSGRWELLALYHRETIGAAELSRIDLDRYAAASTAPVVSLLQIRELEGFQADH